MKKHEAYKEEFGYIHGNFGRTYFRRILSGKNETPVICIHGGPGGTHFLMLDLIKLSKDRDVIFYDQIGCGMSDQLKSKKHMSISTYVDELERLRKSLRIKKFILLGHSWGTMLGMDYYLKYPDKVEKIVFSSPCLNANAWFTDAKRLIKKLSSLSNRNLLLNLLKTNKYPKRNVKIDQAIQAYYKRFVFGKINFSSPNMIATKAMMGTDVYNHMWGPIEFRPTGVLKKYNRFPEISKIRVPLLFTCGENDESTPESLKVAASLNARSKIHIFKGAAHLSFLSNTKEYLKVMSTFMK